MRVLVIGAGMVGARATAVGSTKSSRSTRKASKPTEVHHGLSTSDQAFHSIAKGVSESSKQKATAETAIPLDDADSSFSEFNQ